MGFFYEHIDLSKTLPAPPDTVVQAAQTLAARIKTPAEARAAIQSALPDIEKYAPNAEFLIACGLMLEKKRAKEGMLEAWSELHNLFPDQVLPFRMMMRWFCRARQVEEGLQRLYQLYPDRDSDLKQADRAMLGFMELKVSVELDIMMENIQKTYPDADFLRAKYVRILLQQDRIFEANLAAQSIQNKDKLNKTFRDILEQVKESAAKIESYGLKDSAAVIGHMVERYQTRTPRALAKDGLGPVVFFTGQLGAGGAERQMTRISSAFQQFYQDKTPISGCDLLFPPKVCVRHATASSRSDFFLPVLQEAGVDVCILNKIEPPARADLPEMTDDLYEMLEFLPADIQQNTLKLIPYFRKNKTDIAYFWQDGGVLAAATAALIAGVPRIITSFRGLPPSQRPELMRPQMPHLYKALFKVPGVTFTANSQSTASAYEDWLNLDTGAISVIRNAVPPIAPDGSQKDQDIWDDICKRSPECDKTVLGIFRFDHNKRPSYWIDVAAAYIKRHPKTRFVVAGQGTEFIVSQRKILQIGLEDQIFLVGPTQHVGFYLHKADLVMHLARVEGLPNVVIEAHLSGTPVLATPAGGTDEILEDGITGFLLSQAHDPQLDEILNRLEAILTDDTLRKKMGAAAVKHTEKEFLIDHVLNKTVSLFTHT